MTDDLFPTSQAHDVGGKVRIRDRSAAERRAVFSDCRQYRYSLEITWERGRHAVMFVMMNPSTADTTHDDPTVAKCVRYAKRWGCGRVFIGNTFAYRATDQRRLAEVADPVGPDNGWHLRRMAEQAARVVLAYGTPKIASLRSAGDEVVEMLAMMRKPAYVLRLSKAGIPCHPLYLPESLKPVRWNA